MKNVNLILGDNGEGKSSVLRALAIGMLSPTLRESGFVPYRLVRRPARGKETAFITVDVQPTKLDHLKSTYKGTLRSYVFARPFGSRDRLSFPSSEWLPVLRELLDDYSPSLFVAGYGATRRIEAEEVVPSSARKMRGDRYQRVAGLFEDHVALRPLQSWLHRLTGVRRKRAIELLSKVLPPSLKFRGKYDRTDDQYIFEFDGKPMPLSALSDGFKAFIGWTSDLIGHLAEICPPRERIDRIPGIVLVDEIDLHLHPAWQRLVVSTIASAFPAIQFVFTSHSPLIASTVHRENIFISESVAGSAATVRQIAEDPYGRGVEQILLSSYFGLNTTRSESFRDEAEVLFRKAARGDSSAALRYLSNLKMESAVRPKSKSSKQRPAGKSTNGTKAAPSRSGKKSRRVG